MMHRSNVLRVNASEEQERYREAVAEILRNVQADHKTTLLEISEKIGVSLGTMSNAANRKADLNAIYLGRLGDAYGPHTLDPYLRLIGGRAVPISPEGGDDVLPVMTLAAAIWLFRRTEQSPASLVSPNVAGAVGAVYVLVRSMPRLPSAKTKNFQVRASFSSTESGVAPSQTSSSVMVSPAASIFSVRCFACVLLFIIQ